MASQFNVYCDESCHLEGESQSLMVLGALWCPTEKARDVAVRIREIKHQHGLAATFEAKWSKVSPAKVAFYKDVIDYFFDDDDLHFRALVADKSRLDHDSFKQTHDDWYYKMYFTLLKQLIQPSCTYRIFLDIKDSRSAAKVGHLRDVLSSSVLDFRHEIIQLLQTVRSHEVEQVQLADLLIGAVGYANRGTATSEAKLALVERVRRRSKYRLTASTLPLEEKTNIFIWKPRSAAR